MIERAVAGGPGPLIAADGMAAAFQDQLAVAADVIGAGAALAANVQRGAIGDVGAGRLDHHRAAGLVHHAGAAEIADPERDTDIQRTARDVQFGRGAGTTSTIMVSHLAVPLVTAKAPWVTAPSPFSMVELLMMRVPAPFFTKVPQGLV